ncbi:MAG: DNA double-strand break repair nuclease NurA [Dehalococcoidales bacterium]|nr:DNA double-strand break repair nuclease NurA [Dehalococcoidales bacterium]
MTLDIARIAPEIELMVSRIKSGNREQIEHLHNALSRINDKDLDLEKLRRKIENKKYPWPVAELFEGLSLRLPAPAAPADYTVLATDGSHIAIDRHQAARCFLINTGTVRIQYGRNFSADLDSIPQLYSGEEDLLIREDSNRYRQQQIEGALLDARRSVEEVGRLAKMAAAEGGNDTAAAERADAETAGAEQSEGPVLALLDGSLVLFGLESYPSFVHEHLLDRGFLKALDEIKKVNDSRPLSLASYISLPGSSDVANILRLAVCPQENPDCERTCSEGSAACDIVSGINDRMLFAEFLAAGERSALFKNPSAVLKHYGRHQVYFFYLRGEEEIARVEVPEWVAMNRHLLDLAHALVLDQCRRGQGYPVALSEAHEKAVITGADRQEFWDLVEESMVGERIPVNTSIKSRSKRTRWI